jgi:peptidoglycan hydrolase-like protein with peptidoglycan-binding domain
VTGSWLRWILALALAVAIQPALAGGADQAASLEPEQIRMVQRALQERGHAVELTSSWDAGTQAALANFQAKSGLPPTGELDPATSHALGMDPAAVMPVSGTKRAEPIDPAFNCGVNNTADCLPGH